MKLQSLLASLALPLLSCQPQKAAAPPLGDVLPFCLDDHAPTTEKALFLGVQGDRACTLLPLANRESEVRVEALWVLHRPPQSQGGLSPVVIRTEPQDDGQVRIGLYEQFVGGLGPQWRSAVWVSSFVAANVLAKDLTQYRFTAETPGFIDGPSAGALITAAFLASIIGDQVLPRATMTGTMNPDGTVGPVGGIPQKFRAALERGMTRLGYPLGQRYAVDADTGNAVDLHELAQSYGAEAFELSDVGDAYECLVGKSLPHPKPVDRDSMKLGQSSLERFEQSHSDIREQVFESLSKFRGPELEDPESDLYALAIDEFERAELLSDKRQLAASYLGLSRALTYLETIEFLGVIEEALRTGSEPSKTRLNQRLSEVSDLDGIFQSLANIEPQTIGDHLRILSTSQEAIQVWGFQQFGLSQLRQRFEALGQPGRMPPRNRRDLLEPFVLPALTLARSQVALQKARKTLTFEKIDSLAFHCQLPTVARSTRNYQSAAGANLAYFDALFVKDTANQLQIPDDSARAVLLSSDPDRLTAQMAFDLPRSQSPVIEKLKASWGEDSVSWNLLTLSGSILSYFKATSMISKWYSLRVTADPLTGEPRSVQRPEVLERILERTEERVREYARASWIATGSIPVRAKLYYQAAIADQDGDVRAKLRALESFWFASVFCQAAVTLSRRSSLP